MDDGPELRRATEADAGAIRALTLEAYARWVPVLGHEPQPMLVDHDEAVRRHRIDLLHVDGELVGLIELVLEDDHLLIESVAVRTACQGRGIGRRLLAHAEAVAAAAGRPTVRLYTNKLMAENVRLYAGLGYHIDGEVAFSGGFRINMSRDIAIPGA